MWVGLSIAHLDVDFWIDDYRFFEGGPADEIKSVESAVASTSWGIIKIR